MLLHCVFCNFRPDTTGAAQRDVLSALAAFSTSLDGVIAFDHGPNLDFEAKSPDHDSGFVIRFRDRAALAQYAQHETHQALGRQLCDLCVGGAEGVVVYDLDIGDQ